jgi:hypothetical protein
MDRETTSNFGFLTACEKRRLVKRIAESELFRKAPRVREFFLYAADCTLENRLEDVREHAIAANVFRRDGNVYDLQDSIVRAEARNLRRRLEQYFQTEGKSERVIVSMPKGGYALSFEPRQESATAEDDTTARSRGSGRKAVFALSGSIAGGALLILAISHWVGAIANTALARQQAGLPFSAVFTNHSETLVVTSDVTALHILGITGRPIRLSDYVVRAYPRLTVSPPGLLDMWNRLELTDSNEVAMALRLIKRNSQFLSHVFLRSGHQIQLSDFENHNVVLIGSPLSNPWAQIYTDRLNFYFDMDPHLGIVIRNRAPRSGERAEYPNTYDRDHNRSYAEIALLPGSSNSGNALLIAGTTAAATVAAGDLATGPDFERQLRKYGINPRGKPIYFEILLRATAFATEPTHSEILAFRSGRDS